MLEVDGLVKTFGRNRVLDDISVQFEQSKLHLIVGSNGAGKSTLLRCLLGLENHGGTVTWNDQPLTPERRLVAPVFDFAPAYPQLNGHQNIRVLAPDSANGPHEYLQEHRLRAKVSSYSHGERMRLALMMALNSSAPLLVLDEPSSGLDHAAMMQLLDDLTSMAGQRTVLVVDHNQELYAPMAATISAVGDGALTQSRCDHLPTDDEPPRRRGA